jgi:anti-sigma B factor antagonist
MIDTSSPTGNPTQLASTAFFAISQRDLDPHTSLLAVEGELDLSSAPNLKWALIDRLDAGRTRLIVDLSLTTFMDSTALGVLIGVSRSLDEGARMAIVCARPNVLKIFEFAGLDGALAIFPTRGEALAHVRMSPAPSG